MALTRAKRKAAVKPADVETANLVDVEVLGEGKIRVRPEDVLCDFAFEDTSSGQEIWLMHRAWLNGDDRWLPLCVRYGERIFVSRFMPAG